MADCERCDDEKFVDSGEKADLLKTKTGFLKLDNKVSVKMPCPKCNTSKEAKNHENQ